MLKVCFQDVETGQRAWLSFPESRRELQEISERLGKDSAVEIAQVESDSWGLSAHLVEKTVVSQMGYQEVDFLERRMECLTKKELELFHAALEIEQPYTLAEMVNLSCNLDKFVLFEGASDTEKLGEYLLNHKEDAREEYAEGSDPGQIGGRYVKEYRGCFSPMGYVRRIGEPLTPVYDRNHLPDVGYEAGSVLRLQLDSPFYREANPGGYSLFLPACEEKLKKAAEILTVPDIEDSKLWYFTSEVSGLEEVLPLTYGIRELNEFAAYLKQENLLASKESRETLFSALEAERPETIGEALKIAGHLERYELFPEEVGTAQDYGRYLLEQAQPPLDEELKPFIDMEGYGAFQMEKRGITQTENGLLLRKDQPVRKLPDQLVEMKLFSPLTAILYGRDEYGYSYDQPEDMTPAELCSYRKEIEEQIRNEHLDSEGERGLAVYLDHRILKQKVYGMEPAVESWNGELWGVLKVSSYGELSKSELHAVMEEWSGQASDGWGEGFEQRPIETEAGELYVSFWNSGSGYFITTEEELKNHPLCQPEIKMGGM